MQAGQFQGGGHTVPIDAAIGVDHKRDIGLFRDFEIRSPDPNGLFLPVAEQELLIVAVKERHGYVDFIAA